MNNNTPSRRSRPPRPLPRLVAAAAVALLAACSTVARAPAPALDKGAAWVVAPFVNYTETPLAGQRAAAIGEALLVAAGAPRVRRYEPAAPESPFEAAPAKAQADALAFARQEGARYLVVGSVDEWRYKQGLDGEPAAGLVVTLVDVKTGAPVWTAVGGKTGWSRESLAAVGQKLLAELLAPVLPRKE